MSSYKAKISLQEAKRRNNQRWSNAEQRKYDHPGRGKYERIRHQYFIDAYDMKSGDKIDTRMAFGAKNLQHERHIIYANNKHRRYKLKIYNQTRGKYLKR